ncbi:uncharacterized protein BDR25DRAFT_297899 [Lindgomyces ingoldianus]|uniref:Uncharacterized protein n=1 Tax=Lindgomyces ingoldianus TaxID=673940 RepID=A0ACB6Q9B8_9PLEO|nr:uncharacterized protein BDR25DRAFT_297899 [Lindgomyces ingoldianus]KAF2463549.1 hypothetical protein BDR25DRAFT_297899 [Lindgomyces ingoldianus]
MSTKSAESRSNSPEGGPEKRVSKKRKVLSCYACRNRKMKCDRVYPVCGRCQRTGRADQCTYDPRLLDELPVSGDGHVDGANFMHADSSTNGITSSTAIPPDALSWRVRVQERRLEILEKKLTKFDDTRPASVTTPASHLDGFDGEELSIRETMMFRGKSFKTQFYGATSPMSLINQFNQLQWFTRQAMSLDSSMHRIRGDFKGFRNRRKALLKERGPLTQGTDAEILALVPEKSVLDAQVSLYFQTFETSHRILHEPSFWDEYREFWVQGNGKDVPVNFATCLVLITAITKCLASDRETVFIGDSSTERESASTLVDVCDRWLARQSRKHLTLGFVQLQCLSLLAKRVNCVKMKQDWVHSGDVIRLAISSGMHRNPALLAGGRVSEFEKEMRRRLWATMMELELQSSIDCGLQSSLCGLYFDTQPPANISDEALSADLQQALTSSPTTHFTSTSYLNVSMRSIPLRIHLTQLLNNPTTSLHYSDVLHYDAQITSLLASLPSWSNSRATVPSALLDLQLRQFLVILHQPYALLASSNPRFSYSFTACINAASAVLSLYDGMIEKGIFVLNHARNDVFRTAITLSQVVYHNCSLSSPPPRSTSANTPASSTAAPSLSQPTEPTSSSKVSSNGPHPLVEIPRFPQDNFMMATLCRASIELLGRAVSIFENKVMRLGTGYMENWLLCAATAIMPSPTSASTHPTSMTQSSYTEEINSRGKKAIDRITRLCFRVLAMQKDPSNDFASSLRSTMATASPPEARTSLPVGVPTPGTLGSGSDASMQGMPGMNGIPGIAGIAMALGSGAGTDYQAPFEGLQDMQVDMGGWTFPDIWAFDMGGDF